MHADYFKRLMESSKLFCFFAKLKQFLYVKCTLLPDVNTAVRLTWPELGRLLTNSYLLMIPNWMTKIIVSNVIHYITHFREYNQITFDLTRLSHWLTQDNLVP